jgi:hydroxylamine reductase
MDGAKEVPMFCYQCEQTAMGSGCTVKGVCGKDSVTATLQDLLVHATKGVAVYADRARALGVIDRETDVFVIEALFTTVTNVDFDPARIEGFLKRARTVCARIQGLYEDACRKQGVAVAQFNGVTTWEPAADLAGLALQGETVSVTSRRAAAGDDLTGLAELVTYGLKGAGVRRRRALRRVPRRLGLPGDHGP